MSKFIRWGHKKLAGFSLLELMVVVAIIGVLATIAVPRFNIFRARARQSEAKTNLGVIFTLQESFAIDHEHYYDGNQATWGGTQMSTSATRDGYRGGGVTTCLTNKLGFRVANCGKTRYGYWMAGGNENTFLSLAYATSDNSNTGARRIFPGCDGGTGSVIVTDNDSQTGIDHCSPDHNANTSIAGGDAWCLDENRTLENYADIAENCAN